MTKRRLAVWQLSVGFLVGLMAMTSCKGATAPKANPTRAVIASPTTIATPKLVKPSATASPLPTRTAVPTTVEPTATEEEAVWVLTIPTPYEACKGTYLTRIWVGGFAYVSVKPPFPNNVRSGAGKSYPVIGKIKAGYPMEILEGPECANNWTWWKVRSLVDNLTGWTAEGDVDGYWLVPCPPEGECGVMSENP